MAEIDRLVEDFLAQKRIAVAGVSDQRQTGCNLVYRNLKKAGYEVAAVNPPLEQFEGDPCYPDLRSIPRPAGGGLHPYEARGDRPDRGPVRRARDHACLA
jgi:predicted CoA-binding protein